MKSATILAVQTREKAAKPNDLRAAGLVPCVVYGNKLENSSVQCNAKEFHTVYRTAGENKVVEVDVAGKKIPCLIHAVSFDPVSGNYEHIDFYAVDMKKKVTAKVPMVVKGESPAVKSQGGVLITVHDHLEVSCLPADIPEAFIVDISILENFHQSILAGSLKIPEGVTLKTNPDTVLLTIHEPRKEEVVVAAVEGAALDGAAPADGAAAPAAVGAAAPKVEEKGKKEDAKKK